MITAVEFVLSPVEAMMIAQTSTHIFVPLTLPPSSSLFRISSEEAESSLIENM